MVSEVTGGMNFGIEGMLVKVQTDISDGLPVFNMIGSLSNEVREARERVRTALKNCGFHLPTKRISVNMAPADIKKSGNSFDLAVAVSVFVAVGAADLSITDKYLFLGELSLDGRLSPIKGVLPIVKHAIDQGYHRCILPIDNVREASLLPGMEAYGFSHLNEVYAFLNGMKKEPYHPGSNDHQSLDHNRIKGITAALSGKDESSAGDRPSYSSPDFSLLRGQKEARRAMEIAAAGFHNVFLSGPPGTGKSMLAACMPGIMPEMTMEECIETTMIYSVKGLIEDKNALIRTRPFRAPSHGVTAAGLYGGGIVPQPGEISLAHHGVLFLDELPEYPQPLLDQLRIPLESHRINIVRQERTLTYPADFLLICAANPCLCGYYPDRERCRCTDRQIRSYRSRISGPILDRIDLFVRCGQVPYEILSRNQKEESSAVIRKRVEAARKLQQKRFARNVSACNGRMSQEEIVKHCKLDPAGEKLMERVFRKLRLTGRSYFRMLKLARTIADLDGSDQIREDHLTEAVHYRQV